MKLTPAFRSRLGTYGLAASSVLLVATFTADMLILAYYNSHPSWLNVCFYVIIASFFLTSLSAITSLFGYGWKRFLGIVLAGVTMLLVLWAGTVG